VPLPELLGALQRTTEEEAVRLLDAARAEAEAILAGARTRARERLEHVLSTERARLEGAAERRRLEKRRALKGRVLRAQAVLIERILSAARDRAALTLTWPEYATALEHDVGRLLELARESPGTLHCAGTDLERVKSWSSASGVRVEAADEVTAGVRFTDAESRFTVDLTLPARLVAAGPALAIALVKTMEVTG
jgi:vacuolar-type H+-ATPase subunit E/Vma4